MKRVSPGALVMVLLAVVGACIAGGLAPSKAAPDGGIAASQQKSQQNLQQNPVRRTGAQVSTSGLVVRILPDDRDGSRHQKFIIRADSGETLLIAHNIDLAPRLEGLTAGERVRVSGEFAWNPRGGTLHWTHHDPQGRHVPGYIEWRGRRYQ